MTWVGPAVLVTFLLVQSLVVPMLVRASLAAGNRPTEHWTQYASRVTDVRVSNVIGLWLGSLSAFTYAWFFGSPYRTISSTSVTLLGLAVVVMSTTWNSYRNTRKYTVIPVAGFGSYAVRLLGVWWPLAFLPILALIAPSSFTSWWMLPWFALIATWALSLRFVVAVQVRIGVLEEASERTARIALDAARALAIEPPQVFHVNTMAPGAAALLGMSTVIVATSTVELLDDGELEAVLLHEMAHLLRPELSLRSGLMYAPLLPMLLLKPLASLGFLGFFALVIALALSAVISTSASRAGTHKESEADRVAIERSHETEALGRALIKVHMVGLTPANVKGDGHPPLYDRLVSSGITPDFARDDGQLTTRRSKIGMFTGIFAWFVLVIFVLPLPPGDGGTDSHIRIGLSSDPSEALTAVGYAEAEAERYDIALPYLDAAADQGDAAAEVYRVWALAGAGRCDEAFDAQESIGNAIHPVDLETASEWIAYCYNHT